MNLDEEVLSMGIKKVLHIKYDPLSAHELIGKVIPEYRTNLYQVNYIDIDDTITEVDSIEKFCTKYTQLTNLHAFDIILFNIIKLKTMIK